MLKEIMYTGIGAAALLKEKLEEEVAKLEEKGKIKADDAKALLESIEQKGREEDEKMKIALKESLKEAIAELGIATKEELAKLKEDLTSQP